MGKLEGKRPLGRPRHRWVDNIRIDLQEVGCGYMDWIGLAQDRESWRTLVSAVMNLRVTWNAGNFLTSCKPVSFSRRTLHHGASNYLHITPFKVISIEKYSPLQPRFPVFEAFPEDVLWTLKVNQSSFAYTLSNKLGVRWQFSPVSPEKLYSHFVSFLTKRDSGRSFSIRQKLFVDTTPKKRWSVLFAIRSTFNDDATG